MLCPTCRAPLAEAAPIYRVSLSWFDEDKVVQHHCDRCLVRHSYRDANRWREPIACEGCNRPMMFDKYRKIPAIVACGPDCHRAERAAQARKKRARGREAAGKCVWCFAPFTPTRLDERFCSSRCRQEHHRWRHARIDA